MVLSGATVQNKNLVVVDFLPGEDLGSRVEDVSAGHIVVSNMNLGVTTTQGKASTKLRNSQISSTSRDGELVFDRSLAGIIRMTNYKERRGRAVASKQRSHSQVGIVGIRGGSQASRVGHEVSG